MSQVLSDLRVDLRQVVEEIEFLLSRVLPKSISVRIEMPADLRPLSGDATQIAQMLLNLCINARDAIPDGGVLTIAAANRPFEESAGNVLDGRSWCYVRLTVSDTRCDIRASAVRRIFDPSYSTNEEDSGRNRGLFNVLDIVRRHEGTLSVDSPPNGGARFVIDFPACSVKPTLLIAEADADLRRAYHMLCSARGFDVQSSADGIECLNKLGEAIPQVLVVDLDIPWGGGDGLLACLGEHLVDSSRPIVVVTGGDSRETISERSGVSARNCFVKPFRVSAMLDLVCGALAGQSGFDLGSGSGR